jgi:hypothetical protein
MTPFWLEELPFAIVMTALFAAVGFNSPSWSRSFTSAARYRSALAAHVTLYLLLFLVTFALLSHLPANLAVESVMRAPPVWLALGITLCVRAIPPFARGLREHLHSMAGISDYAIRRGTFLADSDIEASAAVQARARTMLMACGIDAERDWLPIAQPLHQQMSRMAQLFVQLCRWEHKPKFAHFIAETANEMFRLRQRFDGLSFRVSRTLATIETLAEIKQIFSQQASSSEDLDKQLKPMVRNMIADACEDVALFHRDACLLAVRGVLSTESMRRGRERAIARLGFAKDEPEVLSVYRVFPYAAAVLFIGLWVFFLVLPPASIVPTTQAEQHLTLGQLIVIILLIVMGALTIAIFPKLHYGFANCGLRQKTPWPFILSAGICAVLFAVLVNVEAGALIYGGRAGVLKRLMEGLPYLPSAFLTASTVAWLVQDNRYRSVKSAAMRRLLDAGAFGMIWLASTVIATYLREGNLNTLTSTACFGAFVLGAAMGALIPELVRSNRFRGADGAVIAPPLYTLPQQMPEPGAPASSSVDGPGPRAAA